jgi:hypothetical protein
VDPPSFLEDACHSLTLKLLNVFASSQKIGEKGEERYISFHLINPTLDGIFLLLCLHMHETNMKYLGTFRDS